MTEPAQRITKASGVETKKLVRSTQGFTYGFSKPIQGICDVPASDSELVAKVCGSLAGLSLHDPPFEVSVECYRDYYECYGYGYTIPIDFEQLSTLRYNISDRIVNVRYDPLKSAPLGGDGIHAGAICIVVVSNAGVSSDVVLKQSISDAESVLREESWNDSMALRDTLEVEKETQKYWAKRKNKLRSKYVRDPNSGRKTTKKKKNVQKTAPTKSVMSSIFG